MKSTVDQIRERFDKEVERFSNLQEGQAATIDSPLCMELVTRAAAATTPGAKDLLDIGCGAGNYTLKMLELRPAMNCTLIDLSRAMLDRAVQRVEPQTDGSVRAIQGDMRQIDLGIESFDIVLAASTLHHLRGDEEWRGMFGNIHRALRRGGSFWVFDLIEQATPPITAMMRERYGEYLLSLKGGGAEGAAYREKVFEYIAQEDTPRPLVYQLNLMQSVGFVNVDVLHKNSMFAAFGGSKEKL
jgi:tRNA (cmo5U34)-methyltransferase